MLGKSFFLKLKGLLKKFGVDKSIAYSSGARIAQAFTGVGSVFFISTFLTETEQGFYYTFGSLLALQVFFELGLTNILTQYIAFESANLKWENEHTLTGNKINLSRLSHLLHFSLTWYSIIGLLFWIFLIFGGYYFFSEYSHKNESVNWIQPWLLVSLSTVLNLFSTPFLAILTGLDKVKEVAKLRFYQQLITPIFIWVGLVLKWGLFVLGIGQFCSFLLCCLWLFITPMFKILQNIWKVKIIEKVNYKKEIFPYQWKIAISWISGYFVLQLFNPVLFAKDGAIIAGQMGMSLVAFTAIASFSQSWINTKIPIMTKLIARKEYEQLDTIFNLTVRQLSKVFLVLLALFFSFLYILRVLHLPLGDRFLSWCPLILIAVPIFVSQFVNAWATYLRCHKKEPLLYYSMVTGGLCCLSTLILGSEFGVIGMTGGYCAIIFLMAFWAHHIFKSLRVKWHNINSE